MTKADQLVDSVLAIPRSEWTGVFVRHAGLKPEAAWVEAVSQRVAQVYGPVWRAAVAGVNSPDLASQRASAFLVALILSDYSSRIRSFCDTLDASTASTESPLSILDRLPNHIAVVLENARKIVFHAQPERPQDGARSAG